MKSIRNKTSIKRTVYGMGYLGEGLHPASHNGSNTRVYSVWSGMMQRAYSEKLHEKYPTYKDCVVCDEWHCFQVFAEWFFSQPNSMMNGFDLDKDLIVSGNKIYSPEYCSFVPSEINKIMNTNKSNKGKYPNGVERVRNSFRASVSLGGVRIKSSCVSTVEQALSDYNQIKSEYIKRVAKKNSGVLDERVLRFLNSWSGNV